HGAFNLKGNSHQVPSFLDFPKARRESDPARRLAVAIKLYERSEPVPNMEPAVPRPRSSAGRDAYADTTSVPLAGQGKSHPHRSAVRIVALDLKARRQRAHEGEPQPEPWILGVWAHPVSVVGDDDEQGIRHQQLRPQVDRPGLVLAIGVDHGVPN